MDRKSFSPQLGCAYAEVMLLPPNTFIKRVISLFLIIWAGWAGVQANAAIVTISGTFEISNMPIDVATDGFVEMGDFFNFSIELDDSISGVTPPAPPFPGIDVYLFENIVTSISIEPVPGNSGSYDPGSFTLESSEVILSNASLDAVTIFLTIDGMEPIAPTVPVTSFVFTLRAPAGTFVNPGLPETSTLAEVWQLAPLAEDSETRLAGFTNGEETLRELASGELTELAVVPEPGAGALLSGTCALALLMLRRRRG